MEFYLHFVKHPIPRDANHFHFPSDRRQGHRELCNFLTSVARVKFEALVFLRITKCLQLIENSSFPNSFPRSQVAHHMTLLLGGDWLKTWGLKTDCRLCDVAKSNAFGPSKSRRHNGNSQLLVMSMEQDLQSSPSTSRLAKQ